MVSMADRTETIAPNFNAIRISIASPEQIKSWSHGEVTKPETINYRTLRPEKDGLFCERLFGPTKDWECFCGKYKRIRYRGVVCDRCGVEVTRAKVRRERMGHISLAAPVAHIWFSKTNPSRLGLLLDLSPRNLERVLYFAQHIIIAVDDTARQEAVEAEQLKYDLDVEKLRETAADNLAQLNRDLLQFTGGRQPETANPAQEFAPEGGEPDPNLQEIQQRIDAEKNRLTATEKELDTQLKTALDDLNDIQKMKLLAESRYRDLSDRYPYVFKAGMGAEAILEILSQIDLEAMRDQLINDMHSTSGQRRQKAIKRLRVVESFRQSGGPRGDGPGEGSRVENMILTMMPVLPPELRPMVQLDGGRFATSDLNDLYRRVINRNNRLKRLMSLGAPEIIIRNEKRMLQEAVDALIDNGRRGRPIQGSHNHKLKSLSDLLRGKQGRFRQNLLGKRVDYSGRSVIVVGPELKMDECGLPRRMALELFKPFVMHRLVMLGIAPNIKNAKRMVERARGEVWDILEEVIKNRPVLLNRAPTLHRLGIQAFKPKLIDGNAIQIHPLVCSAFNADFDGDQMAVHVPLSSMAVLEARETMLSTHNMLSPASGDPLVAPTLDMVMGCYYLTAVDERPDIKGKGRKFRDINHARAAYAKGELDLRAPIYVRHFRGSDQKGGYYETTLGRLEFNQVLPDSFVKNEKLSEAVRMQNKNIYTDEPVPGDLPEDRRALNGVTADLYDNLSNDETSKALDAIKNIGFQYATSSGITIAINDIQVSPKKTDILAATESLVEQYNDEYQMGLISEEERYGKIIDAWAQASFQTAALVGNDMTSYGGVGIMALSGTKGNTSQINQMAGMRGLMNRPRSGVIEMPVKSSFREGMSALEYFISTHGSRKGLTDTALNTARSGYLTRRLIDIAQEVIVESEDCGTFEGWIPRRPAAHTSMTLQERISGRRAVAAIADPDTGEILIERNETITREKAGELVIQAGITEIPVRSPLTCAALRGVCQMCYGDLAATGQLVQEGQAVGIIAAQSIGEPGTQLTMRTFHTGGVFGVRDERAIRRANAIQNIANRISSSDESVPNELSLAFDERVDALRQAFAVRGDFPVLDIKPDTPDSEVFVEYFMLYDEDDHNRALRRLFTEAHEGLGKIIFPREGNITQEVKLPGIGNRVLESHWDLSKPENLAGMISDWVEQAINLRPGIGERLIYIATGIRREVESQNLDITGGLPQVEDIFEARIPKTTAILSDIDGIAEVETTEENRILRVTYREDLREEYALPEGAVIRVQDGDFVDSGMVLATVPQRERYALPDGAEVLVDDGEEVAADMVLASVPNQDDDSETATVPVTAATAGRVEVAEDAITVVSAGEEIIATESGRVEITPGFIWIVWEDTEVREYVFPITTYLNVQDGETVNAGDALTGGPLNPHDILRIRGKEELQSHVIDQVQAVYRSQGVHIHDKHIEIILRQMLRRVQVREPGDTEFIPGEVVDKFAFQEQVERVLAEGGEPATAEQVLLGVTRASLRTDSFLSAASFQETTRVLTEAAVRGQQDYLLGLKENVIIGRLIPAQVEIPGMAELLKPPPAALDFAAMAPGGWLRGPAPGDSDSDAAGLNLFAPDTDDDGFERMVQAVTRTYAREDDDEEEDDDFFDDDDDDDEADATVTPAAEE